jgi:D-tyrosyl-tRNA(Tyr) deacylase
MRAVLQRVRDAKVTVDGAIVGAIERGLLVYLGIGKGDGPAERALLLDKILNVRIFENDAGKFDRSVLDVGGSLLVVSQFTLFANTQKGRRPGFDEAMAPDEAERAYAAFVTEAAARVPVQTGTFRAHMLVTSTNDGPVTLWLDTSKAGGSGS